jgi:hypothetical protein
VHVAAAADDTTAVLDSCRRRVSPSVKEEKKEHRTKVRTFASSILWMVGKSVVRERRVWRILSCLSTPCEMLSFIVWMMAGIAERKTARGDEGLPVEGAEGNGDNFGTFCCAVDEDRAERSP